MKLKIGTFEVEVANHAKAVKKYEEMRDLSGEGASTFPFGELPGGVLIAYNGRLCNTTEVANDCKDVMCITMNDKRLRLSPL